MLAWAAVSGKPQKLGYKPSAHRIGDLIFNKKYPRLPRTSIFYLFLFIFVTMAGQTKNPTTFSIKVGWVSSNIILQFPLLCFYAIKVICAIHIMSTLQGIKKAANQPVNELLQIYHSQKPCQILF